MATDPFGNNVPSVDMAAFKWGVVADKDPPPPKLGVLGLLENKSFKGPGYNCIFRPRSNTPLKNELAIDGIQTQDNDLQLNLTVETLAFSPSLGSIPNRGLFKQPDVVLAGLSYMDSVQDVTNTATGKGDRKGTGIHTEPGVWLAVPGSMASDMDSNASPVTNGHTAPGTQPDTLCRMASIPHGVTINAQGPQPPLTPILGRPQFEKADITPFSVDDNTHERVPLASVIEDGKSVPQFNNMRFEVKKDKSGKDIGNNRMPQNLETFNKEGTITPEILANPNQVLTNAIKDQKIIDFISFKVTTEPTKDIEGGGTANIDFLGGKGATTGTADKQPNANAFASSVTATFWVETVEYTFSVEGGKPTETVRYPAGEFGPTFKVPPTLGRSGDTHFKVNYTQLQYSQEVILNFFGLSWPHVSVATLGEQTTFNLVLPPLEPIKEPKTNGCKDGTRSCPPDDQRYTQGEWGKKFDLPNVPVHASLLPTGKVLYWGRRTKPGDSNADSMKEKATHAFLLDLSTQQSTPTKSSPTLTTGNSVNLFCSGHCFQPDGTLFIVGGHLEDGHGVNQACVYDPFKDTWTSKPRMNYGRWYPSALTLNDGSTLAISGSYYDDTDNSTPMDDIPQIWRKDEWISMPRMSDAILQSFPRLHLDPHGRIFMAGPQAQSQYLDESVDGGVGAWTTDGPSRDGQTRDYAPSVMLDNGKVMYIGGGDPPSNIVEFIDLHDSKPSWVSSPSTNMKFRRRQHNGTVLPDGTVLVTGGTEGNTFNDVFKPVKVPELWDPFATPPQWKQMAEEASDRCYHSIALLLPDGQVLSGGGGEGGDPGLTYCHPDAQLYKPPYLFKGPRPTVSSAPTDINYKQQFEVTVGADDKISKVSWIRLGTVTHACNMSQSLTFLDFQQQSTKVTIHAPADCNVAPPGYYMLFLLNEHGVPSIASMVCIARHGAVPPKTPKKKPAYTHRTSRPKDYKLSLPARNEKIMAEQDQPAVAVGLTPSCPYGLGPCWGAAFDGLRHISDVDVVRPVPDQDNSIAFVYLKHDVLPDIDVWRKEFEKTANKLYHIRGIELTISGAISRRHMGTDEQLVLHGDHRPDVTLAPFYQSSKLEWDRAAKGPREVAEWETSAWSRLSTNLKDGTTASVTGRLQKHGTDNYSLHVRKFEISGSGGIPNGV